MPDTLEALGLGQQTLRIMEERGVQAVSTTCRASSAARASLP